MQAVEAMRARRLVGGVALLWLGYTAVQTLSTLGILHEPTVTMLSLVPVVLGIALLRLVGCSREERFFRLTSISWFSVVLYITLLLFYLLVVIPTGSYRGWDASAALVYAPASAIAQEPFSRGTLLPVLLRLCGPKVVPAFLIHALLFGTWHIGRLLGGAPLGGALAVMIVPMLIGTGWAWQVRHDGTLIWAVLQHTLLLVIMSFYTWG